jgi:hypothetical protein
MSRRVLINIIGKVFIDSEFRKKFRTDTDKALANSDLTAKEKTFLKSKRGKILDSARSLNVTYQGENKRS